MLMTAFAFIQSLKAGAANQIKRADKDVIANLKKERNITIQFIPCTKERYYELLKNLKEIARAPSEVANHYELDYMIAFWAMPKLDEEQVRASVILEKRKPFARILSDHQISSRIIRR